jgi:hypothetical protein
LRVGLPDPELAEFRTGVIADFRILCPVGVEGCFILERIPAPIAVEEQAIVVSVKFCKSGSVVRGFGEIKRFMGRV